MRSLAVLSALVLAHLAVSYTWSQTAKPQPILARDVDRRPLPKVSMAELSTAMQKEVQSLIEELKTDETRQDKDRATPPSLETTIYRIPVAPHGHSLYFVDQTGELACSGTGVNCVQTVLDETASGIETVTDGQGAGVSVVRRPHLQMPDIAAYDQLGHFARNVTVYRWNGTAWHAYLCKEVSPINDDPDPAVVADKPCKP